MMRHNATTRRGRPGWAARRRVPILLTVLGAVTGLVVMSAGAAFAYFTATDSSHPAAAVAATLTAPAGGAQNGTATSTSIPIKWGAPSGYTPTSYTVLRCTGLSCTPTVAVGNGTCHGAITATSCIDTDSTLVAGMTYTYAIEANVYLWVSPASAAFQAATTGGTKLTFTTQPAANANIHAANTTSPDTFSVAVAIQTSGGVTITSDNTDTVTLAIVTDRNPGSGTLTCSGGNTADASSGVATFTGCAINKAGNGYQLTATSATSPSLTPPVNANSFDIVAGPASKLAFTTAPVSGVTSNTANLGPITVQLQDADGNPVTAGATGVTVHLSASPSSGAEFSATQNGTDITNVTIASGSSSVNLWFGDRNAENPVTITAASTGLTSATQPEVVSNPTFSATDLGNGTATCTGGTCTGPTVSTTNGNPELIFVYVKGSGSNSASANTIGGPLSGATLYASQRMTQTEAGGSVDNFLYAYTATGSGGSGAVTFAPSSQASGATVWIDVVELGAGDIATGCVATTCTDGSTGTPALATLFLPGSDSEVAFLGTPDSTDFTAATGFSSLGGGGTNPYGTWSDPTAESSASFPMGAHGKGWGSIAVQVSP
jgi:hypothetical protein